MVEDKNSSQDTVKISGNITLQNVSYEKDVMEIKLAHTIDSDNYDGNFVKDVCVDEGAILHQTISEEKLVDKRSSPNFNCQMIPASSDIRYGKKDDSKKYVHEQKPEAVVPVDFAPDYDNEKQHSSGKEYDHEDRTTTACIAGDASEKKISLQELLRLESAEESRHARTINSESSEIHEEAGGQVALTNTSQHVSSKTSSKDNTSSYSGTMSEDHDAAAALDLREAHKIDRYNPFIDHRLEGASEPECSIPGITDAASIDSICVIDNVVSSSTELDEVEKVEPREAVSTSSSDIQSSGNSDDHSGSVVSKAITGAVDETAVGTSSSINTEPSNANWENQEKCVSDGGADQIDGEHCVGADGAVNKSSTLAQDHSVVEQTAPECSKSTAGIFKDNPSELNFGPSIMSGPLSMSGHIAYSGNVSLRSDSSTTSTRSFAFPVLQREWISSPVRMAKAERRCNRHRRAWRKGLICCKF